MPVFEFNRALVRTPSRSVVEGLRAVDHGAPDFVKLADEHADYVRALEGASVFVEVLPPLEEFPDSVFVEDAALVFTGAAIVLRPGAPTRRGEATAIAPELVRRFDRVLYMEEGFADGGDVLATGRMVFIGRSARTTAEGAGDLISLLADIGLQGMVVSTPPGVLHFKSDCSLLDDETMLATSRLARSHTFAGLRIIRVPEGEEGAANAVRINGRVLVSDAFPRTADLLARSGYDVVPLRTREIAKIDAGLSCMSLRWRA